MKNDRAGKCIPSAYEDMQGIFKDAALDGDVVLVHGWVYSYALEKDIKHAWLEFHKRGVVWDPVAQVILTPDQQKKYNMRPVKRYSYWEMMKMSIRTKSAGGEFEF